MIKNIITLIPFLHVEYTLGIFYQKILNIGFFDDVDEELIGCMSYGYPVGRSVVGSIFTDDKMLTTEKYIRVRLFIHDGLWKKY